MRQLGVGKQQQQLAVAQWLCGSGAVASTASVTAAAVDSLFSEQMQQPGAEQQQQAAQ